MSTAIKFENISKQYRLGLVSTKTISHDLNRWFTTSVLRKEDPYLKIGEENDRTKKAESDYVWALKNINFEVQQGDVLGIIGKNGAGKSTLLKILSKVTGPSTGLIKANGRIASLLEVGTGFHPEMTGRENIYMNGAIMGMKKSEISRKFDEIVDFSGIERYVDTPVKRYSSGMTVRLGFSIAAHLEPEILVVDEVLAVGDAEFQNKAIGKMQDVASGGGRTVLFVSHNMGAVRRLCKTGILLENGMLKRSGEIGEIVGEYINSDVNNVGLYIPKNNAVKEITAEYKNGTITIKLSYESVNPIRFPNLGFIVYSSNLDVIFGTNAARIGVINLNGGFKKGTIECKISSPILSQGTYPITIWFNDGELHQGNPIFEKEYCVSISVSTQNVYYLEKAFDEGHIAPICEWNSEGI